MAFMTDFAAISEALGAVDEMARAISADGGFSLGAVPDLAGSLARARAEGAFLPAEEFLLVAKSLATASEVSRFFTGEPSGEDEEDGESRRPYPLLSARAAVLDPLPLLAGEIGRVIDQYGNVRDNASPELAGIRSELSRISGTANAILRRVMARAVEEGLLDSDAAPSVRDGRLVIPVPPMNKRRIQGIVHDQSASGKTYFIEPAEVVEVNNRQRQLQLDEQREIARILTLLTASLRPYIPVLAENTARLGWFDFVQAKARYAAETGGMMPRLADIPELEWFHAV
ncbi:MAG: endonuclease MutS2, partial [Muribaculaceae bacterium]|nr:endonuclease MutS2 [Muribaculaceae bacterium]